MPYQWTIERERQMLLLAICSTNLKPSWPLVAELLGEGLTPSAVSQKYHKLRNESLKLFQDRAGFTPSTPTKRKASHGAESIPTTPSKRARTSTMAPKYENYDGEPFSDDSSNASGFKAEDAAQSHLNVYSAYKGLYVPDGYFQHGDGQIYGGNSSGSSFVG